jgi:hypothetical protein
MTRGRRIFNDRFNNKKIYRSGNLKKIKTACIFHEFCQGFKEGKD